MVPCFRRDEFLDSRWSLPRTCRSDPLRRPASGYGAGMTIYAYFKHRIAQFRYYKIDERKLGDSFMLL